MYISLSDISLSLEIFVADMSLHKVLFSHSFLYFSFSLLEMFHLRQVIM